MPFWSPDSRDLGFFAGGALKRVSAAGGPVRLVTDNIGPWSGYGGAWAADGTIAVSREAGSLPRLGGRRCDDCPDKTTKRGLVALLAEFSAGRTPVPFHREAVYPDGGSQRTRHLPRVAGQPEDRAASARSLECRVRLARLFGLRPRGTLAAAPFDLAAGRVTGPPIAIGGAVATDVQFYFAGISASADGTLAVRPPPAVVFPESNALKTELRLVDRSGTGSRVAAARLFSYFMALSPIDSRALATSIQDLRAGTTDLSLVDLSKDRTEPMTTTRGFSGNPVWSADGKRLAYAYQPPGQIDDVYIKDLPPGRSSLS